MLESKHIEVSTRTNSIVMNTTQGCTQGGVLSPLIWSMVVDELLDELTNTEIQVQGYTDDILLILGANVKIPYVVESELEVKSY